MLLEHIINYDLGRTDVDMKINQDKKIAKYYPLDEAVITW